jgi:hypothetical protein
VAGIPHQPAQRLVAAADSDLLLNHLAALLQALPGGMQEEITLYSPTRTSTACSPRASAASPT